MLREVQQVLVKTLTCIGQYSHHICNPTATMTLIIYNRVTIRALHKNYLPKFYSEKIIYPCLFYLDIQRMRLKWANGSGFALGAGFATSGDPNTFQNRKVSSPAADATVFPSGLWKTKRQYIIRTWTRDRPILQKHQSTRWNSKFNWRSMHTWAMNRTLEVWPVSSAIFTIDGYFQRVSWFCVNPWELSNSRSCLLHWREHTWEPVFTEFKQAPVWVFQNLMHWSPPPPPEANKFPWNGHQARAFTAAVWSSSLWSHCVGEFEEAMDLSHMKRRLSFPPLASCCPEADHLSPQTSCWCPL